MWSLLGLSEWLKLLALLTQLSWKIRTGVSRNRILKKSHQGLPDSKSLSPGRCHPKPLVKRNLVHCCLGTNHQKCIPLISLQRIEGLSSLGHQGKIRLLLQLFCLLRSLPLLCMWCTISHWRATTGLRLLRKWVLLDQPLLWIYQSWLEVQCFRKLFHQRWF